MIWSILLIIAVVIYVFMAFLASAAIWGKTHRLGKTILVTVFWPVFYVIGLGMLAKRFWVKFAEEHRE